MALAIAVTAGVYRADAREEASVHHVGVVQFVGPAGGVERRRGGIRARRALGEWAVIKVVAHMADVDDRGHARLHRMLDEDNPRLPVFDQDALAEERGYITVARPSASSLARDGRAAGVARGGAGAHGKRGSG